MDPAEINSGRIMMLCPPAIVEEVKAAAAADGRSVASWLRKVVDGALAAQGRGKA